MGLVLGLGVCLFMLTVYSMCMVAGEADRQMEQDLIQMKKDRQDYKTGSASDSERDHE